MTDDGYSVYKNNVNSMSSRSGSTNLGREKIILPLNSELAESVLMLGDYFPRRHRTAMIEKVISILLLSLLQPDPDIHIDAMERVHSTHCEPDANTGKMWGEFMTIISVFRDLYEHDKIMIQALHDILPSDLRVFPEEIFQVKWSTDANYLLIE